MRPRLKALLRAATSGATWALCARIPDTTNKQSGNPDAVLACALGENRLLMDLVSPTHIQARPLALANLLTYGRIAAVPAVVGCLYFQDDPRHGDWLRWVALLIFI